MKPTKWGEKNQWQQWCKGHFWEKKGASEQISTTHILFLTELGFYQTFLGLTKYHSEVQPKGNAYESHDQLPPSLHFLAW